jgi:hypothetical protein
MAQPQRERNGAAQLQKSGFVTLSAPKVSQHDAYALASMPSVGQGCGRHHPVHDALAEGVPNRPSPTPAFLAAN